MGLLDPVPRSLGEALARDAIGLLPVLGDLYNLAEAVEAFRRGYRAVALLYLLQALPGPSTPLLHVTIYRAYKKPG